MVFNRTRGWIGRRLERRIAAYSVVTILGLSLIFGAISFVASLGLIRQHQRSELEGRLERIVARLDDKADVFVRHVQDLAKNSVVFSALLDSGGRNIYLLPFFADYQFPFDEPHGLALCDFEGKLLAERKLHPVGCLTDLSQSRTVIDVEQPQAVIVVLHQQPHLALFQPVFYPGTGRAEGYILATLDLSALVAEKHLTGSNATLTLRFADRHRPFATQSGAMVAPPALTDEQPIRPLFAKGPFAAAGLTLALDEPGHFFTGITPLLVGYGLGTLALLALALLLSHLLAHRLAEPLLMLNQAARRIAVEGPTAGLAAIQRTDEVGELAVSFNQMIAALRQAQESLEAQVQVRTAELRQALVKVEQSQKQTRAILDSVSYQIAVLDRDGVIMAVNEPWRRFALENGIDSAQPAQRVAVGVNYLGVCQEAIGEWEKEAIAAHAGIEAVLAGRRSHFALEYPCHSPYEQRWFLMRVTPLDVEEGGVVIAHADITERKEAERLLTAQRDLLLALDQANTPVIAMQAILDTALSFSGVDSGGIYEVDPSNGDLALRVHRGLTAAYIAAVQTRAGDSPTARVVRAGQPIYSFIQPLYPELPDFIKAEGLRAYAIIPILHHGQAVACFNLASHQGETIPPTTCQALETLALELGGVLTRLRTQTELEEQRVNLSAVFDTLEDFLFILDEQGHILRVNPVVERRLGYVQQELIGRHVLGVHPPDRREEAGQIVAAMLAGQADFCPVPLLTRNGQQIPVETRVVPGQWSGHPALIGLSRDITIRKAAEDALRASESRFHTLVDLLPYGVQEDDLTGRIIFANPALERLRGQEEGTIIGRYIWDFLTDDTERQALQDYRQFLIREQPPPAPYFAKNRRPDGSIIDVQVDWAYRRDQGGWLQGFVAVVTDITERKQLQEALREQAIRDPLTGLFNRRYLDETLPRELGRCQRSGELLVVAMLDLDHFKRFNDTYGHEAGDAVLRTVGDLLGKTLRAGDLPCRYGGEELTLILHGSTLEDAQLRLDSLRRAIRQTRMFYRGGELPAITVSIGVAAAEAAETDATALLNRADAALYQAKTQGRNRVVAAVGGQPSNQPTGNSSENW